MGNCLKTQLKEVVSNSNLEKMNILTVKVTGIDPNEFVINTSGKLNLQVADGKTVNIKVYGEGGWFVTDPSFASDVTKHLTELQLSHNNYGDTALYFSNGDYTIDFDEKYDLTKINPNSTGLPILSFNGDSLKYSQLSTIIWNNNTVTGNVSSLSNMTDLTMIILSNTSKFKGDLSQLPVVPITRFTNSNGVISGSLSDFNKFAATLETLEINGNYSITGKLENIGLLIHLTNLNITNTSIGGDIENFVSAQYAATRTVLTTGITCSSLLKYVKFGGILHIEEDGVQHLCWDTETKIYILCGSTTSNFNKVYCKGYTAEEAAAKWPGKTIIRVED